MNVKGSLFLKMFVGFWLICITILGAWLLSGNYLANQRDELRHLQHPPDGAPPAGILKILYRLQNANLAEIHEFIEKIEKRHALRIYVVDRTHRDLLERPLHHRIRFLLKEGEGQTDRRSSNESGLENEGESRREGGGIAENHGDRSSDDRHRMTGNRMAGNRPDGNRPDKAQSHRPPPAVYPIFNQQLGPLTVVVEQRKPKRALYGDLRHALINTLWLQLVLAIIISGLFCYGLSYLLTARLKEVNRAANRLADGDLSARVAVKSQGGDEANQLALGFNMMAARVEETLMAQQRLLRDVSHELKSPLARLQVTLALAEKEDGDSIHLQRIATEAARLEDLVFQLLQSNTLNAMELEDTIDLGQLLEDLCDKANFQYKLEQKSTRLTFPTERELRPIYLVKTAGDLLLKAFGNVIDNAMQHSPNGETVTLNVAIKNGEAIVQVRDRGPGVKASELSSIFFEFFRSDDSRSNKGQSYGLGLSIAKRAIELHKGRIEAVNSEPGLTVSIALPLAPVIEEEL